MFNLTGGAGSGDNDGDVAPILVSGGIDSQIIAYRTRAQFQVRPVKVAPFPHRSPVTLITHTRTADDGDNDNNNDNDDGDDDEKGDEGAITGGSDARGRFLVHHGSRLGEFDDTKQHMHCIHSHYIQHNTHVTLQFHTTAPRVTAR
jgi:hypothetical protein